jgi:hypothetical protein
LETMVTEAGGAFGGKTIPGRPTLIRIAANSLIWKGE